METVECEQCKSVMGLVKKTPRWALYKCFSCRHIMGRINNELKQDEFKDAEMEMDFYADSLIKPELTDIASRLQKKSPEDLKRFFEKKEGNEMYDDIVANMQAQPKGRGVSHDWLSALQNYEFAICFVVSRNGDRMCVECVDKHWTYRAFFDVHGEECIFQWVVDHQSIGQLNKQEQDDLAKQIAQASSGSELDFKGNMARVRVRHIGIPKDYYLAVENSVRELDSVIPIVLSTFAKGGTKGSG